MINRYIHHFGHRIGRCAILALGVLSALPAVSQDNFPTKPIRIILSVGAGGATDVMMRGIAERVKTTLGVPILVENQGAASGIIAAQTVARAAPDGYTILVGTNGTHAGNAAFFKSLPYDPIKDFEPITRLGIGTLVLCVNNELPVSNVKEFIAYAKANPGKLAFGSGTGSARLGSEMLKAKAGIEIFSVPYKSNAAALTDLRGGQIQILLGDIALMKPQIRAGAVKGLGVSSASRSAAMPEIPTLAEAGVPGYELVGFSAVFAPAKTPASIIRRLNAEIVRVLQDKDFAQNLANAGLEAAPTTPEQLRSFVVSETLKWQDLARAAGVVPE